MRLGPNKLDEIIDSLRYLGPFHPTKIHLLLVMTRSVRNIV